DLDVKGLNQSGARAFLEKSGFTNISFVTQDSEYEKGTVISQTPAYGQEALADDAIKVVISSGVTTTTTKPSAKVSLSVALPEYIDSDGNYITDTLVVELDDEKYLNQTVNLKGGKANVSITVESDKNVKIRVSLKTVGALETKTVDPSKNQNISVDFSGFSNIPNETTTQPTTVTTTETTTENTTNSVTEESTEEDVDNDTPTDEDTE
ncbi:MAG: PASTA domain-containing protein, partial [Eubacterium sp.]